MITFSEQEHKYQLDGKPVPCVSDILQDCGITDFSKVHKKVLDFAQKRGKAIHKACHLHDIGDLDTLSMDKRIEPYLDAWIKFKHDTGFMVKHSELIVGSKIFYFAGRLDKLGTLESKNTLIDVKSGPILPGVAIQLSAYELAYNEDKTFREKIRRREAVQLKDDGTWAYGPNDLFGPTDRSIFLAALSIFNFKRRR